MIDFTKDPTSNQEEALLEIFRKLRPEDSINLENAKDFLDKLFFDKRRFYLGKVGRYQMNKKFGIETPITTDDYLLKTSDIVNIIKALVQLNQELFLRRRR